MKTEVPFRKTCKLLFSWLKYLDLNSNKNHVKICGVPGQVVLWDKFIALNHPTCAKTINSRKWDKPDKQKNEDKSQWNKENTNLKDSNKLKLKADFKGQIKMHKID